MRPFKLGICVDECPYDKVAPGWDYYEYPASFGGMPFASDALWAEQKKKMEATGKLFWSTMDYVRDHGLSCCGPTHDPAQHRIWAERLFPRLASVGTKYVGVYGGYFPDVTGFDRTKAYDQAIGSCNVMADLAEKYGMLIALEPNARAETLWPRYLQAVQFAKETGRRSIRVMADLNYFVALNQPLEDVLKDPEFLVSAHIQGNNAPGRPTWAGQPNVGDRGPVIEKFFQVLKKMKYSLGVTAACSWVSTKGGELDWTYETGLTLKYLDEMIKRVYG
jgi:sugar phosphate isomerase/epimerase